MNKDNSFGILAVGILLLVLVAVKPEITLFVGAIVYIVAGVFLDLYRVLFHRPSRREQVANAKHGL